jgi:hypothetical protein
MHRATSSRGKGRSGSEVYSCGWVSALVVPVTVGRMPRVRAPADSEQMNERSTSPVCGALPVLYGAERKGAAVAWTTSQVW